MSVTARCFPPRDPGPLQGGLPASAAPASSSARRALRLAIGASRRTTFYSFTCPECGSAVRKPAGERIIELLTGGGVRTAPPPLHRLGSASMFWPMTAIALGFLGIAVLGVLAVKVFVEAQRLGRQVADTTQRDQPRRRGPGARAPSTSRAPGKR